MQKQHKSPFAVQVRHCTKTFGKVVANDDVHLDLRWGEIHALLGENGSGKTTLVNMLAGIYQPDEGEITVDGERVSITSPKDAYRLGIGMIHQHFMLVDVLTAAENIVLGLKGGMFLDHQKISDEIRRIADTYGFPGIVPEQRVSSMSVSEKQTVEIVKALYRGAEILILDEPTAVLTPQETERLFSVLRAMRDEGKCIVLISHKMNELFAVADRVTILRKGAFIEEVPMNEATVEQLTGDMVGHAVDLSLTCAPNPNQFDMLSVQDLSVRNADGVLNLDHVTFDARGGEILGVAGIAGSGQKELCDALAGLAQPETGSIRVKGKEIVGQTAQAVADAGIRVAYVPEDRLGMGLVPSLGMVDNVMLRSYRSGKGMLLDRKTPARVCGDIVKQLDVSTPDLKTPVRRLSGGNVQKVLLGREIHGKPDVLIAAYPVRGLDIGATQKIYEMMNEEKLRGSCVIFVGEDLDTLMSLCDRLLVLCNGRVAGLVDPRQVSRNDVGLMMMDDKQKAEVGQA